MIQVFEGRNLKPGSEGLAGYDIDRDGRIVIVEDPGQDGSLSVEVVLNGLNALTERAIARSSRE